MWVNVANQRGLDHLLGRSSCHVSTTGVAHASLLRIAGVSEVNQGQMGWYVMCTTLMRLYDFLEYFVILMFSISPVSTAEVVSAVYFCWAICMKTAPHVGGSSIRLPCWDLRQYSLELQAQFRDVKRRIVEGGVCVCKSLSEAANASRISHEVMLDMQYLVRIQNGPWLNINGFPIWQSKMLPPNCLGHDQVWKMIWRFHTIFETRHTRHLKILADNFVLIGNYQWGSTFNKIGYISTIVSYQFYGMSAVTKPWLFGVYKGLYYPVI